MEEVTSPHAPRGVRWGVAGGLCMVAAALAIGLRPLSDNSFFTHLSTGRLIVDGGSVPSVDPYSFTAPGEPWVVQSWLASVLYGAAEKLGGGLGLRLVSGAVAAALTLLAWRLTRPAEGIVVRLGLCGLVVGVGASLWAERPFMLGLLALGLVVLVAEGGLDPRWLVPVGWLWVNTHGSFPLGVGYLVVALIGRALDREPLEELPALRWLGLGIIAGAVSPVGPKLLLFPVELLQRQDLLKNVIEWRAPAFDSLGQRLWLLQLVLVVVLLVRRPSYRRGLLVAVFTTAALLGARNLTVASLVFLPVTVAAAPSVGSLRSSDRAGPAGVLALAAVAGMVLVASVRLGQPDFELRGYPVDALAYLEEAEVDLEAHHLAAPDVAGNLLELVYGPGERVFYDDRFDMFPEDVSAAHLALVRADAGARRALDEHAIELVVWSRNGAIAQRLIADAGWRLLYTDERWVALCRRDADLGGQLGTC